MIDDSSLPPNYDPKTHVLRRRGGKWVAVDKQVLRWRKSRSKAPKRPQEASEAPSSPSPSDLTPAERFKVF